MDPQGDRAQRRAARDLFDVVSNPEFLREGTAVSDFLHPDRIVVGADSDRAAAVLRDIYAPLTSGEYYKKEDAIPGPCGVNAAPPLLNTSTKSAEIIKHASNAFLAVKDLVHQRGLEPLRGDRRQRGAGRDRHGARRPHRPALSAARASVMAVPASPRTSLPSVRWPSSFGIDFSLLTEVEKINGQQKKRFLNKVRAALWTLRGKKLGVLGLAFKGETDDIRESPAIDLVEMLLAEGCSIKLPSIRRRWNGPRNAFPLVPNLEYVESSYAAAEDADALLILTDWAEFAKLDLKRLNTALRYPIVIDGRNLYDPQAMLEHGLTYISIGRPAANPPREHA